MTNLMKSYTEPIIFYHFDTIISCHILVRYEYWKAPENTQFATNFWAIIDFLIEFTTLDGSGHWCQTVSTSAPVSTSAEYADTGVPQEDLSSFFYPSDHTF